VLSSSSETSDPAQALGAREIVESLLAHLEPADRWLITMLELEEKSIEEVRQLTGWSSTRIRVRAFRARRKLNKLFKSLKDRGKL